MDEPREYGIGLAQDRTLHRTGFTKKEAEQWVQEWIAEGGNEVTFKVISRPITPWTDSSGAKYVLD